MLPALPMKSLSSNIVSKRSALSMEEFLCDYFLSGCPVVISECMAHWPARTKWNDMDYLKRIAGYRTVPVEVIIFLVFGRVLLVKTISVEMTSLYRSGFQSLISNLLLALF